MIDVLRAYGADRAPHAGGRTLLEHLVGTRDILRRWGAPESLQSAALMHSVYGTDAHPHQLIPASARRQLAAAAGETAERLAYLFCMTPREPLLAGTRHWAPELPLRDVGGDPPAAPPSRVELDALVLLHMANIAEQACAPDGSPGRWVARCADLAQLLDRDGPIKPPPFTGSVPELTEQDEALARRAYRAAIGRPDDLGVRTNRFALAAAACPAVAEPCVWLAYVARAAGDGVTARAWLAEARRRLRALGGAWDKRLGYQEWLALIDRLEAPAGETARAAAELTDPRALFARVLTPPADESPRPAQAPPAATGRARFQRYVEALATAGADGTRVPYPDLAGQCWHDPGTFPLVGYLEAHFAAIREELLGLDGARFQRESERIARTGEWEVVFLYERGRRHDDVCRACPVTARGIETYPTMRTASGLIYVSRMQAGTHIAPHRGPTNLRLRCHLGLAVPDGDCGIRVGTETRRWQEGRCLVFDDSFEHEAWNHTEADRIVLIVDVWHPGLSPAEVTLLGGLHEYMSAYGRRLGRYWATNASARQRSAGR